jgi:thioredoxin 1
MKARFSYFTGYVVISLLGSVAQLCSGQASSNSTESKSFPPLEQWRMAVSNHDAAALKAFYSTSPAARISTPKGEIDADGDVAFWVGLRVRKLKVDVSQADSPGPDLKQLVLQMEIYPAGLSGEQILYLSAGEVWQHQGDQWRLIASRRSDAARLEQPLSVSKNIYSPGSDAHAEIKRAVEAASKQHKRVIVVFGANWCYDCHVLDAAFHRPDLAAVVANNYEVVHVDVGRGDKNQDLMEQYQVPMKKGIPGLAVLDADGKLVTSQKNGEFENARALGPKDLLVFLNQWRPPAR